MKVIEIRASIEASYSQPVALNEAFMQRLKWRLHDMMWSGFTTPHQTPEACLSWCFDVDSSSEKKVSINIDGRYLAENTEGLIEQMHSEIEKHLSFALTPCGYVAPVEHSLKIKEWPYNRSEKRIAA